MKSPPPLCPFCGSSATLPFEDGGSEAAERPRVTETVLATLLFFLLLFAALVFFLLSRASLPAAILLALALILSWRRGGERLHRQRERPRPYICLDCSRYFRAT